MDLKERLVDCANRWVAAQGGEASLSRLSKRVLDNSKFFERLDEMRLGPTTGTLENFARFFAEPENWPDGDLPPQVEKFVHIVGVSAADAALSPDSDSDNIGEAA